LRTSNVNFKRDPKAIFKFLKFQKYIVANLLFELGSVGRLNRVYKSTDLNEKEQSRAQVLISRAYRRTRGELDQFIKELPESDSPVFCNSLTDSFLSNISITDAVDSLRNRGFYTIPVQIPDYLVRHLRNLADNSSAIPKSDDNKQAEQGVPNDSAPTWWVNQNNVISNPATQEILAEKYISSVVHQYLESEPRIVSCTVWKSFPSIQPQKSGAQWFHVDYDRVSFVKLFIYLNDVNLLNGPHIYVSGSHRKKPWRLLSGRRIPDSKVEKYFARDNWVSITGKSGFAFFADTRGLHKGMNVSEGSRSIFSLTYSIDSFGYQAGAKSSANVLTNEKLVQINSEFPQFLQSVIN
jgi:hypothetical protein